MVFANNRNYEENSLQNSQFQKTNNERGKKKTAAKQETIPVCVNIAVFMPTMFPLESSKGPPLPNTNST